MDETLKEQIEKKNMNEKTLDRNMKENGRLKADGADRGGHQAP